MTLKDIFDYFDEAKERQKFECEWLDDNYDKHIFDVGYFLEGLEVIKLELARKFGNGVLCFDLYDKSDLYSFRAYKIEDEFYKWDGKSLIKMNLDDVPENAIRIRMPDMVKIPTK